MYFPSRFEEGYGFHASSVRELSSRGPCLFITTDCGITGVEGCLEAALQSSDVIITDHHLPGERLPEAYSILNPTYLSGLRLDYGISPGQALPTSWRRLYSAKRA